MVSPERSPSRRDDGTLGAPERRHGVAPHLQVAGVADETGRSGIGRAGPALPRAVLPRGWYPDPYRRWNARYWDGLLWTGQVAHPGDDALPLVFGNDPVAPPAAADAAVVDGSKSMRYEAAVAGELAHLRGEVDTWRGVAGERARALTSALNALESLAEGRDTSTDPTACVEPGDTFAPESAFAPIPDVVRIAAQCELLALNSKPRRWWQRIIETPIRRVHQASASDAFATPGSWSRSG
jgi:hypothetical protein